MAGGSRIIDRDRGWKRIKKAFSGPGGLVLKVGVQGAEASAAHDGGITNVGLAVVHEYGASISHPGGTPFAVAWGGGGRSGGMTGGAVTFLKKGSANADGVTAPHRINIPERSFIRAPFAANTPKYWRMLKKGIKKVLAGKMTRKQLLGLVGEVAKADMQRAMAAGIAPPIKASTIRARKRKFGKASSKPLIATGQLRQSLTWVVKNNPTKAAK